jgi:hypothetical protein
VDAVAASEIWDALPPDSLLAAGWCQGAVFSLPGATYAWIDKADSGDREPAKIRTRQIRARELLVLASQDCDILSTDEPRVEALLVRIKDKAGDRGYLARIANNSYREFVLDPERGFVADARVRVQIAKELLNGIKPDPWAMDGRTREDFVDWLAGRYDRPPIQTAIFEALCRPIRNELERLQAEAPDIFAALNRSVRRIRIRLPPPGSPTLDLGLLFILEDAIDDEGARVVEATVEEIKRLVAEGDMDCHLEVDLVPYGELLLVEFDKTRPLDVDYMTDQGDEIKLSKIEVLTD